MLYLCNHWSYELGWFFILTRKGMFLLIIYIIHIQGKKQKCLKYHFRAKRNEKGLNFKTLDKQKCGFTYTCKISLNMRNDLNYL